MKDGGERNLVSLVVEKAQQLNQVSDLFALVETSAEHGLIRNVGATKDRLVDLHLRHRAKQERDVAVLQLVRSLGEREDAARELLRVEHAGVLLGARIVFERRLCRHEQLDEWAIVAQVALRLALLVLHVTKLVEVFVLTRRHVVRNLEQPREEIVEE